MNIHLKKIRKNTSIEINPQRIIGQNLCKINKHFLRFPFKRYYNHVNHPTHDKIIYHKNLFYFFPRYLNIHLGNTLLVDDMPYRTCLNPPFNAIFVEFYKDLPKENNYLMKTFLLYLKSFHYTRLSVCIFVELYPFGTIRSLKEYDVRFWTLFQKCTMACCAIFV